MSNLPNEASFLKNVAHHKMEVLRDDGLYRHLRFRTNTSWHMSFTLTTWPGYLCFAGDMGCYVFSRAPDMIEFFRRPQPVGTDLFIDFGYWAQKAQAVDPNGGISEYSPDKFRSRIAEWLDDVEASPELRREVSDSVLSHADDGEDAAMRAAYNFEYKGFQFDDVHEINVKEYTYRFLWCCYALAWAVQQYDARSAPVATGATT